MHLLLCQVAPFEAVEATILRALCDVQFDMQNLQAMNSRGAARTSWTYSQVREGNWSSFKAPPPHPRHTRGLGQDGQEDGNDGGGKGSQDTWAGYQQGAKGGNGPYYPPGPAGGQGQGWHGQPQ